MLERNDGETWQVLERAQPRGGIFEKEDADVRRGRRYGYRLADAAGSPVSEEAWIAIPVRTELDVRRIGANPGGGPLRFAVSTPGGQALGLELLDVAGRVIDRRAENDPSEGTHTWTLGDRTPLPAGCYFVRLSAGAQRKMRSVIVLR